MIVQELEKDTLIVADLISEARLNDAAEIAREMQQLRSEIASLIGELRRGQTPELQRALMAALDRAERRMQALQATAPSGHAVRAGRVRQPPGAAGQHLDRRAS